MSNHLDFFFLPSEEIIKANKNKWGSRSLAGPPLPQPSIIGGWLALRAGRARRAYQSEVATASWATSRRHPVSASRPAPSRHPDRTDLQIEWSAATTSSSCCSSSSWRRHGSSRRPFAAGNQGGARGSDRSAHGVKPVVGRGNGLGFRVVGRDTTPEAEGATRWRPDPPFASGWCIKTCFFLT